MLKLPIRTEAAFLALCARFKKDPAAHLDMIVGAYLMQVAAVDRAKARAEREDAKVRAVDGQRHKERA